MKAAIRKKYGTTDLRGDGQVVVVSFSDGMKVEVVSVISTTTAADSQVWYPNTNDGGSFKLMDPKAEQVVS